VVIGFDVVRGWLVAPQLRCESPRKTMKSEISGFTGMVFVHCDSELIFFEEDYHLMKVVSLFFESWFIACY